MFGKEAHRRIGSSASAVEDLEQMRRQALVQGAAAGRADMHPIALQAIGQGAVAFIDRGADPGALQALRQGEAADAAADDQDMKGLGHFKLL